MINLLTSQVTTAVKKQTTLEMEKEQMEKFLLLEIEKLRLHLSEKNSELLEKDSKLEEKSSELLTRNWELIDKEMELKAKNEELMEMNAELERLSLNCEELKIEIGSHKCPEIEEKIDISEDDRIDGLDARNRLDSHEMEIKKWRFDRLFKSRFAVPDVTDPKNLVRFGKSCSEEGEVVGNCLVTLFKEVGYDEIWIAVTDEYFHYKHKVADVENIIRDPWRRPDRFCIVFDSRCTMEFVCPSFDRDEIVSYLRLVKSLQTGGDWKLTTEGALDDFVESTFGKR
jgi:hypothetical protein